MEKHSRKKQMNIVLTLLITSYSCNNILSFSSEGLPLKKLLNIFFLHRYSNIVYFGLAASTFFVTSATTHLKFYWLCRNITTSYYIPLLSWVSFCWPKNSTDTNAMSMAKTCNFNWLRPLTVNRWTVLFSVISNNSTI